MAQLKDTVVTGNLRVTNKILTDSLQLTQAKTAVTGTGTTGSTDGSTYYPSKWTFDMGVTLQDGVIVTIIVPAAGHANGVYVSVDNGTTYKPVVLNGTTILTTHYAANMPMVLIYDEDATTGSMAPLNGGAKAAQTGGAWRFLNFYDSNTNVTQNIKTDNTNRPLLMSNYAVGSTSTSSTSTNRAQAIYANASTGTITTPKVNTKAIIAQTGSGTAGQDKGSGVSPRYIPALWTFNSDITVTNGEVYFIKIPVAGGTYGVWLSLNNGTNYYPVAVSNGSYRFTTHYGANTVIAVTYESAGVCQCYAKNGADELAGVTGIFRVLNDYDTNTRNTAGATNSTSKLYLIGAPSQNADPQTYSHSQVYETDGTLYLTKTTDASGTANNKPALIVGGTDTSSHLEFDDNEIMAKANATTPAQLYLNKDGGAVNIGSGGLNISGELVLATENTSAEIYDEIVDITVSDSNNDYKGQLELVEGSATIRGDGPSNKYCYISANYDGINIGCYDNYGSQSYTINSQGIYQGSTNIYDVIKNTVEQIAPDFSPLTTYSLGDYCLGPEDELYCYTSSTPSSGAWDSTKWTQTTVTAELGNINSILEEVL